MIPLFPFRGIFQNAQRDLQESFYLYEIHKQNVPAVRGLVCSISLSQIQSGALLCHEEIYEEHRDALLEEFSVSKMQKNPVLLITDDPLFRRQMQRFTEEGKFLQQSEHSDGSLHRLLRIAVEGQISLLGPLCIADGHHRYAALTRYNHAKQRESRMMVAIFDQKDVLTRAKGIVVQDIRINFEALLEKLDRFFTIQSISSPSVPVNPYDYTMFLQDRWYSLYLKSCFSKLQEVDELLGIEVFKRYVLQHAFHLPGYAKCASVKVLFEACNIEALTQMSWDQGKIGFLTAADFAEKVMLAAKNGRILEANSTYFEPKLVNQLIGLGL